MPRPEDIELPGEIPAIVLGGCTLFPHCLMPLFIFEQRYRDMLEYALESDRVFAVAAVPPGVDPDKNPEEILSITTAGLVRACVQHDDGTSHLMLQGLKRVRISDWDTSQSFRIGKCESIGCIDRDTDKARVLANDLIDITTHLCGEGMPMSERVQSHLRGVKCASAIADVVAHNFVSDPLQRQVILETLNVPERLQLLHRHVHQMISGE